MKTSSNTFFKILTAAEVKDQIITIALAHAASREGHRLQDNRDNAAEILGVSRRSLDREIQRRYNENF